MDATNIGNINFGRPDDQLTFVGVSSNQLFNRIEVREIIGNSDNEFFGNFTTAVQVPAPGSILIVLAGLLWLRQKPAD